MRIGIITLALVNNYGGLLQNFALQQVLHSLGHDPITLDQFRFKPSSKWYVITSYCKTTLRNFIKGEHRIPRYKYLLLRSLPPKNMAAFKERYIDYTSQIYGYKKTRKFAELLGLEGFVVGSDQVWRLEYNSRILNNFLDFTDGWNVRRVAYASSFGKEEWNASPKLQKEATRLLSNFDMVSVREDTGVKLCREKFGVEAKLVLDPTMLIDKSIYMEIANSDNSQMSKGGMFCYILDQTEEKNCFVNKCKTHYGLEPFMIMPPYPLTRNAMTVEQARDFAPVSTWLKSFMDAKVVVCDSFHGAVFSIIFNKPFFVLANVQRGFSRFETLLKTFGLENRLVSDATSERIFDETINWDTVNQILTQKRAECISWLAESLNPKN